MRSGREGVVAAADGRRGCRRHAHRHLPGRRVRRPRGVAGVRPRRRSVDVRALRRERGLPRAPGCRHGLPGRGGRPRRRGAGRAERRQRPQRLGRDASAEVSAESVNGLEAQVVDAGATSSEVAAEFPAAGVSATLTYRDSDDDRPPDPGVVPERGIMRTKRTLLLAVVGIGLLLAAACPARRPPPPPPGPPRGFDACAAPSASTMSAWRPRRTRRSGSTSAAPTAACAQPNLTKSWVSTVTGQGWKLLPIWVGPQASCTTLGQHHEDPQRRVPGAPDRRERSGQRRPTPPTPSGSRGWRPSTSTWRRIRVAGRAPRRC